MSDAVLLALIAAIASTVATLITAIVGLVIAMQTAKKVQENSEKTAEIHAATNGTLSEVKKLNAVSEQKIKGLEDLISEKNLVKQEAQVVAQQQAAQPSNVAPLQVAPTTALNPETGKAHLEIKATIVGAPTGIEDVAGTIKPK